MPDERASALDAEGGDTAVSVEMIAEVEHAMEAFFAIEDPEETEGGAEEAEPHHPHGERFAGGQRGDVGERVGDDGRVFGAETTVDHEALMFVGGEGVGDRLMKARRGQRAEGAGGREALEQVLLEGGQGAHERGVGGSRPDHGDDGVADVGVGHPRAVLIAKLFGGAQLRGAGGDTSRRDFKELPFLVGCEGKFHFSVGEHG